MHSLIRRQLRKLGLDADHRPSTDEEWAAFLGRMDLLCTEADQDRYTFERASSISSRELSELYEEVRRGMAEQSRSLATLRATLESTTDGILVMSAAGEVVVYNARFVEISGMPPELAARKDLVEWRAFSRANALDPDEYERAIARDRDEGTAILKHRNGKVLERHTRPQLLDGQVVGRVISLRDVTDRYYHEEQLRAVNTRFTALISNLPGGNLVLDEALRVMHVNREFCAIFGIAARPTELVGLPGAALVERYRPQLAHPERYTRELEQRTLERRSTSREEVELADGRMLERDYFPIFVEGTCQGHFWQYRDVTESRRIKFTLARSEQMASVGVMAAGVAHEINNPLAYVLNNLEFLAGMVTGEAAGVVAEARHGAERVRDIVRNLKTFSRVQYERPEPVDLRRVLDSVCRMAANEIRARATLVRDEGELPRVMGNESRFAQVFLNLIVNACHAIPEGAADRNSIAIRTWTDFGGQATVEVRDTGQGMPPEVMKRIFDPFFTTRDGDGGMGLGLSICANIVAEAGGTITVESEPGRGTVFRIALPPTATPGSAAVAPPTSAPGRDRLPALLVVDDEPLLAASFARLLRRHFDVTVCGSGAEALRLLAGRSFDVILCDLMMPGMSGMDLYERLAADPGGNARRMVFVTGGVFTPRGRDFVASLPADRVMEKPFRLDAFLKTAAEIAGA